MNAPFKALLGMLDRSSKPLPHFITEDDWYTATPAQKDEWNARMAMGEHVEPKPVVEIKPQLDLLCTLAEYDAAPVEMQRDYDKRLLQSWDERRVKELGDDASWDKRYSFIGE